MMQLSRRQITVLAIALIALVSLTLFFAPRSGNLRQRGSTYSRSPDGYGAWFAYMQEQGTTIERWRKPLQVLVDPTGPIAQTYKTNDGKPIAPPTPITLLQISNGIDPIIPDTDWLKKGNVLVLLGIQRQVTDAPFTSDLPSRFGKIRIETSRRESTANQPSTANNPEPILLKDEHGIVIWQAPVGKGRIIYATTPYLAANAYQDFQGNYELLADLVKAPGHPIWVDEFLHGYEDPPTIAKDGKPVPKRSLLSYLWDTPLSLLTIQLAVLLGVLLWGQNRRFGPTQPVLPPSVDNSEAYIQAMAGVLHKAECSQFVVETVGKAEQLEIQKALGLGTEPLTIAALAQAWEQQTQRSPADLEAALKTGDRPLSDPELLQWIRTLQTLRSQLP